MLTDNQNKLLDDLKSEFLKMNKPNKIVGGGLINKALIDEKIAQSEKRKAELNSITLATRKAIKELVDIDMERLNYDLIPMGLIANRHETDELFISISLISKKYSDRTLLQYCKALKKERLPNGDIIEYESGLSSISFDCYGFSSIDNLCKNESFIRRIEYYYQLTLKN